MVERAALRVVVEAIRAAANHHLALVGLAHIAVHRVGHNNHIHTRLDRLGYKRLKRNRFHRKPEARHIRQRARVPRHHKAKLVAINRTLRGVHTRDFAAR